MINGTPISKMRRWFVGNTGYVRQLATYYYNELTVRENLLFSMNMQAMRGMSLRQKLERVEQVIREVRVGGRERKRVEGRDSSKVPDYAVIMQTQSHTYDYQTIAL